MSINAAMEHEEGEAYQMHNSDSSEKGSIKSDNSPKIEKRDILEDPPKTSHYGSTASDHVVTANKFKEFLACLTACLGSMAMGTALGYSSPAVPSMTSWQDNHNVLYGLTKDQGSWIGSLMTIGALFGGLAGGPYIEYFGRKLSLIASLVPFAIGWVLIAGSTSVGMMYAGRVITGFCTGIVSLIIPVYIAELASPKYRGMLGSSHQLLVTFGIFYVYAFGCWLQWAWLAVVCLAVLVVLAVMMPFMPETPRWYMSKKKKDAAREALVWVRGSEVGVDHELKLIEDSIREAEALGKMSFKEFAKPTLYKPMAISLALMFFQQFSGINVIMFYTTDIFAAANSDMEPKIQTLVIGAVGVAATLISVAISDLAGRRILLVASSITMAVAMAAIGTYFYLDTETDNDISGLGFLPILSLVVFNVGFSIGFGPIPWLMMGELFPLKARSLAGSIATAVNWLFAFIVTKTFLYIVEGTDPDNNPTGGIGYHGTYWLFGGVCVLAVAFILLFVPETKGRTLEVVACLTACLGSLALGTTIGYSSPAVPDMRNRQDEHNVLYGMSEEQGSWVGSLMTIGALFGGLCAGPLVDYYGRQLSLVLFTVPFAVSWVLVIGSVSVPMMYVGRVLTGFCAGLMSLVVPVYIAEIASSKYRGLLASCHTLAITIGILYVYGFGCFLGWEWLATASLAILVVLAITMPFMPETPRWLLSKKRREEAVDCLQWVRGPTANVEAEVSMIEDNIREAAAAGTVKLKHLLTKSSLMKPMCISLSLMFFQQFCGINVIMFYTTDIFSAAHSTLDPKFQTVIIGAVGVCGTGLAVLIIDLTGRRILLLTSSVVMTAAMMAIGTYFYLDDKGEDVSNLQWLPVTSLVVFYLGYAVAFGPIPWVMMAELFPLKVRGLASSVATSANWLFAFVVTKMFIYIVQGTDPDDKPDGGIGYHGTYWLFGGVCAVSFIVVFFFVPETKGKTLEEIEQSFR